MNELQFYFLGILLLGFTWLLLQVAEVFWLGLILVYENKNAHSELLWPNCVGEKE